MVQRSFWLKRLESLWQERSIVWLCGVRRVGKTCLAQSIDGVEYFDCELPRVRRMLSDPEDFLESVLDKRIVLDEVHRLENPAQLLKIAADHYPKVKILATGSSSLGASAKFKDTLTGRKRELWLTPAISADMPDFHLKDLKYRFLRGGLPPFFLSKKFPERDFQEWVDDYWAKDIQELFRLERKNSFQKFLELVMAQSGGIFEASNFTSQCEVSRTTIANYLNVLEATFVVTVVRPFSSHRPTEIVSAPKVYGFDTGFACYYRGWHELRNQDMGLLWEHFVLNEICAHLQARRVNYWRDKRGHEVDFVLPQKQSTSSPLAIECKWKAEQFDDRNLKAFLRQYPQAEILIVCSDIEKDFFRRLDKTRLTFVNLSGLFKHLENKHFF